ncbi:molybdate ABC transporter substrate-binding protein [Congregibacter variabilis]|uniref:Molybdate ABC transporter substrate-binding protein n=1 Tax=Congregibacter variabilis TaxID=3081200 RepID=A0ABZ0HZH9_9GAMM|nr:molybdate ABC transporter substrate-binding protein [Congregibacter sp. IMCC43200]
MAFLSLFTQSPSYGKDAAALKIAVAANFRVVAEQIGDRFADSTGVPVIISSASTGVLAAQMRRGAPFDLLLAADRARPQALIDDESSPGPAQCYAVGSLVLLGASSLHEALSDPSKSIAVANPRSAPYGAAAMAVLAREEFAAASERRVVRGSNVQQAMQFYTSGGVDLALVARSLSPNSGITVPPEWHPRIEQYAVLNARSNNAQSAQAFLDYLTGLNAVPVLASFGYRPCS